MARRAPYAGASARGEHAGRAVERGLRVEQRTRGAVGDEAEHQEPPGAVAHAVVHRTVEELWYFVSGAGRMWRADESGERIDTVGPGLSLAIPVGTRFQFRADGSTPLVAVGTTMPPWPGPDEAVLVDGPWAATA